MQCAVPCEMQSGLVSSQSETVANLRYDTQPSPEKPLLPVDGNKHRDTQRNTVQRARNWGALSPKWDDLHQSLPSELRNLQEREGRKTI